MEDTTDTSSEQSLLDTGAATNAEAPAATETSTAPTQHSTSYVNPDGTFAEGWANNLPEDSAAYKDTLSKYKSVPDMAKALANANALIGKKLGVPNEKSSPEEVAAFRRSLGVPDTIDEYKFAPDALPEGMTWDDNNVKNYAEIAHKHNIPPSAMKALVTEHARMEHFKMQGMQAQIEKQHVDAVNTLKKEWGGEFDKNIGLAKQAAKIAGVNANSQGFADPEVVRGFVRMAQMMSEDKVGRSMSGSEFMTGSARAKDIMSNPDNSWHKRYMEGDREAATLVTGLLKQG
jgi:hypothetical protein